MSCNVVTLEYKIAIKMNGLKLHVSIWVNLRTLLSLIVLNQCKKSVKENTQISTLTGNLKTCKTILHCLWEESHVVT